jgi:hypothetical protein
VKGLRISPGPQALTREMEVRETLPALRRTQERCSEGPQNLSRPSGAPKRDGNKTNSPGPQALTGMGLRWLLFPPLPLSGCLGSPLVLICPSRFFWIRPDAHVNSGPQKSHRLGTPASRVPSLLPWFLSGFPGLPWGPRVVLGSLWSLQMPLDPIRRRCDFKGSQKSHRLGSPASQVPSGLPLFLSGFPGRSWWPLRFSSRLGFPLVLQMPLDPPRRRCDLKGPQNSHRLGSPASLVPSGLSWFWACGGWPYLAIPDHS